LRLAATKNARSGLRLPKEIRERHAETNRDLPKQTNGGVRLAGLDLRERRAAHARGLRQIVERHATRFALVTKVLGHATAELRRPDVVSERISRGRTARLCPFPLASRQGDLHYNERVAAIANTVVPVNVPWNPNGFVVWLTGLSGAGKTTITDALAPELRAAGRRVEVLDGDVVRTHLSKGLGFSREDRDLNVARIAFVAHLLARNGVAVIVAAVSPYRSAREDARRLIGDFVEVHVAAPLEECIRRDTKGLYGKALAGEIERFTGVSDPYEPPTGAELVLDTSVIDVATAVVSVKGALAARGYIEGALGSREA
jgi:adenylylsulfate kinase